MTKFIVEPSADGDIDELFDTDEDTAATILVVLDELMARPNLRDRLFRHGYRNVENPTFDVEQISRFFRRDYVIYRIKIWDEDGSLLPYRALYAYDGRTETYHVLGIFHRQYAYDETHPKVQRMLADYEALGLFPFS